MKNLALSVILGVSGLAVFLFLLVSVTGGGSVIGQRLPTMPSGARFQVTAAVVELKPDDAVLGGSSFKTVLNDIPKRSRIGLRILETNTVSNESIQ